MGWREGKKGKRRHMNAKRGNSRDGLRSGKFRKVIRNRERELCIREVETGRKWMSSNRCTFENNNTLIYITSI